LQIFDVGLFDLARSSRSLAANQMWKCAIFTRTFGACFSLFWWRCNTHWLYINALWNI